MMLFLSRRLFSADRLLVALYICGISVLYLSCVFTKSVLAEQVSTSKVISAAKAGPIPKSYFGIHVYDPRAEAEWPPVGIGAVRLWDESMTWSSLQPSPEKWEFRYLDRVVLEAEKRGYDVLLVLGQTPIWASQQPDKLSLFGPPASAAGPRNIEDWRKYVRTVATRYKGRIQAYEIWNEINVAFWAGNYTEMAELEREAYKILKSVDPQITVVSADLVNAKRPTVDWFLDKGNGKYADVFGHHFYTQHSSPEEMLASIQMVRDALDKHGLGRKPIWNTETGWLIPEDDGHFSDSRATTTWKDWKHLTPEQGAAYVMRALVLARLAGVERFYWYGWNHGALGLTGNKRSGDHWVSTTKMATTSYLTTINWLVGSQIEDCIHDDKVWSCHLTRGREKSWLVWSVSGDAPVPQNIREQSVALEKFDQSYLEGVPMDTTIGEVPILFLGQHGAW